MEDGHAGHTYGIDLRDRNGGLDRYILKLGPAGVRRSGSADIYRQAPLLKALYGAGLPVPDVPWASASDDELGAPFIVMKRLAGRSFIVWQPDATFLEKPDQLPGLWIQGAENMARLHRADHRRLLSGWEDPTTLEAELERWLALVRHSEDREWRDLLTGLATDLRIAMPDDEPIGLVHGDFQPGNILYDEGSVTGIIDWDLAAIGPQAMDVGWYLMMADANCWDPRWRPVGPPPKAQLVEAYERAGGPAALNLDWHQAFAQFRFGAIAGLNLKLHRNGRRVDPVWEKFALTVPGILHAAFELLCRKPTQ